MKISNLWRYMFAVALMRFSVGEEGGGTGENKEPTTFSLDYVRELRAENKGYRLKLQEAENRAKAAEDKATQATADAEAKIKEATETAGKTANDRILMAELKVKAKEAGLVDLDGLKLADLSKVKLNADGTLDGADALFTGLKEAKPYLFGASNTSSSTETPPTQTPPERKLAKDMTPAEYAAERAKLIA
ncbi:phage scaffolding protein [Chitinimonas naiadis]